MIAFELLAYMALMATQNLDLKTICFGCMRHMSDSQNYLFLFLFAFRYVRLVVHMFSYWLYLPAHISNKPSFSVQDVTVVIPTVDPGNPEFLECLESILKSCPAEVCIVTVGAANLKLLQEKVSPHRKAFPSVQITTYATNIANKRKQVAHVLPRIRTPITVLADDHVFWPNGKFLPSILAPFDDAMVGAVAPHKRVRRLATGFGSAGFWNMMGALYLQRHNFELRATNAIDGGVFVVSGRTAAYRTEIIQDPEFLYRFTNERLFFGLFELSNPDDDNFLTRWVVKRGYKIKFQQSSYSTMETTLVWRAQPWCTYAVHVTSFFNFALFYDAFLLYALWKTTFFNSTTLGIMVGWIVLSKFVKLIPYFIKHPADLIYLPGYYAFAYFHSFIKLYAMLTFWNTHWGGRNLNSAPAMKRRSEDATLSSPSSSSSSYVFINEGVETKATSSQVGKVSQTTAFPPPGGVVMTPWGKVKSRALHNTSANVLQSRQTSWRTVRPLPGQRSASPHNSDEDHPLCVVTSFPDDHHDPLGEPGPTVSSSPRSSRANSASPPRNFRGSDRQRGDECHRLHHADVYRMNSGWPCASSDMFSKY